jgi:hypothetical protein
VAPVVTEGPSPGRRRHVHQLNNKSVLMQELNVMKRKTREKRKAYLAEQEKIS